MQLFYTGEGLKETVALKPTENCPSETINPYKAQPGLIKAVNLAILLERPLLLMGEPGGGKTKLAQALAYELYHEKNGKGHYRDWYFEWFIKSTSKAKDGLYEYDAIRRLRDAQTGGPGALQKPEDYITLGPLGNAIKKSASLAERPVVLIDEIDKADIDFPNDLLNELDQALFDIPETKTTIRSGGAKPIFIITSNREKELPDAFLRRCIYHFIEPLTPQTLEEIIRMRFFRKSEATEQDNQLIDKAIKQFIRVRDAIGESKTAGKNVSTSELLDWYRALKEYADEIDGGSTGAYLEPVREELERFRKGEGGLPLYHALFKNWETLADFQNNQSRYLYTAARGEQP
jgi:MoxR-like ATPase